METSQDKSSEGTELPMVVKESLNALRVDALSKHTSDIKPYNHVPITPIQEGIMTDMMRSVRSLMTSHGKSRTFGDGKTVYSYRSSDYLIVSTHPDNPSEKGGKPALRVTYLKKPFVSSEYKVLKNGSSLNLLVNFGDYPGLNADTLVYKSGSKAEKQINASEWQVITHFLAKALVQMDKKNTI